MSWAEHGEFVIIGGAILVLLVLSGFFSGSETALTGASRSRMHQLTKQGNRRAERVVGLLERKDRLIGAILLGNNLVNILASALATTMFVAWFGDAGVAYATLVMTLLVLIFAEVLPKTYALSHTDRVALAVAPVVRAVVLLFAPVTHTVQMVVRGTLKPFGIDLSMELDGEQHEEELRGAIDLHDGADPDTRHERVMLKSILDLDDVEVADIMTHRRRVVMIDLGDSVADNIDAVLGSPYTRIPVYRDDPDNIVGVLHAKALLREVRARQKTDALRAAERAEAENADDAGKTSAMVAPISDLDSLDLGKLATAPWFIPDSTTLLDQLQAFRARREHFALVIDEYGAFMGIVTLEDILEEIVGNIDDETDIAVPGVRPQPDGAYLVDGSVTLRLLAREFDWSLPDDNAATIAGLVLHEARLIPEPGQIFMFHGFRFEVVRRQRNQITLIRVTPPPPENDDEDDG
ncbi:HlyC/CorC family transporter [Marivibrio halodurans]|uniref:HlyC/CorC family transporter n=1 Tax=Marivibrio halodurans TaxID=2039722 RepID=A0A8J7SQ62_9PROT|nr:HlyC/CorC family transporter [Marivibrio halodurans]MBP5859068.1 HlyC/CorC family transporter [Marivibrio halodurans]